MHKVCDGQKVTAWMQMFCGCGASAVACRPGTELELIRDRLRTDLGQTRTRARLGTDLKPLTELGGLGFVDAKGHVGVEECKASVDVQGS